MNNKKAVLINNPDDFHFLKSIYSRKSKFISRNYFTKFSIATKTESYFSYSPSSKDSKDDEVILYLVFNWFRDLNGNDLSYNNGISIGNIIARRLLSVFANDYKNYCTIRCLLTEYDLLYASVFESPSFKRVSKIFGDRIQWYKPRNNNTGILCPDIDRSPFYHYPRIHSFSKIARIVQKPFLKYVKKRGYLCLPDWTNINHFNKRNDTIVSNPLLPWIGYYFNPNSEFLEEADNIFPKVIDMELLNLNRLRDMAYSTEANVDKDLLTHFSSLVKTEYSSVRPIVKHTYASYKEVFLYYDPSAVIIPGEVHFGYVVAAQLASKMKIKTVLAIDGCMLVADSSQLYKNQNNKKYIFDKFIAYGEAHKEILKSMGVKKNDISICFPTIINRNIKISNSNRKYDVIIMAYNPSQINQIGRWDKRGKFVVDIILLLLNLGFNKLALKIKHMPTSGDYYKNILSLYGLINKVELLSGPLLKHIDKTKLSIGQFSTAAIEFTYYKKPYYIYEPYENGKTDEVINSSVIFNRSSISRNINELENNLKLKKSSIVADRKKLFDGIEISNLDFSKFFDQV